MILSETIANAILDRLLGGAAWTPAASYTVHLYSGDPRDAGTEVDSSGTGYAPIASFTNDSAAWRAAALTKANLAAWRWPASGTASGAFGVVDTIVLRDAVGLTDDVIAPYAGSVYVDSGDTLTIPAGDFQLALHDLSLGGSSFTLTSSLRDAILDRLLGGGTWNVPANWELSLWLGNPVDGGTEVSGGSYDRVLVANNDTTFADASAGKTNNISIDFPAPTGTWGEVAWIGVGLEGAAPSFGMQILNPFVVGTGQPLPLPPGSLRAYWLDL